MRKNIIKQIILCLFIFIFLYICCLGALNLNGITETRYRAETETVTEPRVYVTTHGKRYHNKECFYLISSHARGLYEAQKEGYTICNYCDGEPNGTIDVYYKINVAYEADKHNEIRAIPTALVIGILTCFGVAYWIKKKKANRKIGNFLWVKK